MKGLMKKDLYMLWKYGRAVLLISLAFLVFAVLSGGENTFFVIYPALMGGILPGTLISYDERFGWNKYCDALPLTRKQVVSERYWMSLLSFLALYLLTMAAMAVAMLPRGRGAALLQLAWLLPAIGLLGPTIMLPVIFRWGVEKGRIAYYILIGVTVAAGMIAINEFADAGVALSAVWTATGALVVLALFAASWLLSIRLYEKREL